MEGLLVLALCIPLGLIIGSILGLVAFNRVNSLQKEVTRIKARLAELCDQENKDPTPVELNKSIQYDSRPKPQAPVEQNSIISPSADPIKETEPDRESEKDLDIESISQNKVSEPMSSVSREFEQPNTEAAKATIENKEDKIELLTQSFRKHWMIWLGGLCIALAGVFLAKHSLDQGLLNPSTRVIMGLCLGLGLHAGALYLRRRLGGHESLAALAGGGSITLFAALLAALHMYEMLSPLTVFALLAFVAVATMWLALLHGPVLAVIGMLGAYAVPVMVSTGSGNIVAAMIYALIISASVLLLIRRLKIVTHWHAVLWWGTLAGALFWWFASMFGARAEDWRGLYLAILAYGLIAFSQSNWRLDKTYLLSVWLPNFKTEKKGPAKEIITAEGQTQQWLIASLFLIVGAQILSLLQVGWQTPIFNWCALSALLLWVSGRQPRLASLTWVLFIGSCVALILPQLNEVNGRILVRPIMQQETRGLFVFLFGFALLYFAMAFQNMRIGHAKNWWAAMVAVVPLSFVFLSHLLGVRFHSDWQAALFVLTVGVCYIALATTSLKKGWLRELSIWLFLAGHFAYSFAASILLEQATLTLAIAAQLISIAWLIRRFEVADIGWLLKVVVSVVVVRLSLNPWLEYYPADFVWPLWVYGGATLFSWIATRWLNQNKDLSRWTEVATLHLFVLTLWSLSRYWIHDGQLLEEGYTFPEAVLNTSLFCALGLVYNIKAQVSEHLKKWYQMYSAILLGLAALNYLALVVGGLSSSPWAYKSIGATPIWNILPFAYGLPAALAWLVYRYYSPEFKLPELKKAAMIVSAVGAFIFISLEIRHLWQGTIRLDTPTSDAELYSYSIVWLLLAVVALLLGSLKLGRRCYQAGLMLLGLVIAKIFLVDMAGLDGLLRVASFMGLGLALLAIALFHQRYSEQLLKRIEEK